MNSLKKNSIKVQRYFPKSPLLKGLVKYFWVLRSQGPATLNHKLLPVDNIDLVFNLGCPAQHVADGQEQDTPQYYFRGLQSQPNTTRQSGELNIFGVSFFPAGIYPLLKKPLSEYANQTVDFKAEAGGFSSMLEHRLNPDGAALSQAAVMEQVLAQFIDAQAVPDQNTLGLIRAFSASRAAQSVRSFCAEHGLSQRSLERVFQKHIGTAPKTFQRIQRFQMIVNRLLKPEAAGFTPLAYEHGFFDQAHFINDFKSLAGSSPKRFVEEKLSMRQVLHS